MNLVITISRRYGTGASIIADDLSKKLGIPVYDKAFIEERLNDHDFETEAEAIRKMAEAPCIILGRSASEILKDQKNAFNIYVCADKEERIKRIMEHESLTGEAAREKLERTDQARADYYHECTGKAWGDVNNYHMIMDTTKLGVENCAGILVKYFESKEYI